MTADNDTILIVDDEPHVIAALLRGLHDEPYRVSGAAGSAQALEALRGGSFKVVISDEQMPGMAGAEFLALVKKLYPDTVRMMLTGHASIAATVRAVNNGEIYRFFTKPWDDLELRLAIRGALEKYDLEQENRRLLKTVRRQSQELRYLEQSFPGISDLRKDADGAIRLDDEIPEEEIARIIAQCNAD